jgi:hypothetical protein
MLHITYVTAQSIQHTHQKPSKRCSGFDLYKSTTYFFACVPVHKQNIAIQNGATKLLPAGLESSPGAKPPKIAEEKDRTYAISRPAMPKFNRLKVEAPSRFRSAASCRSNGCWKFWVRASSFGRKCLNKLSLTWNKHSSLKRKWLAWLAANECVHVQDRSCWHSIEARPGTIAVEAQQEDSSAPLPDTATYCWLWLIEMLTLVNWNSNYAVLVTVSKETPQVLILWHDINRVIANHAG